MATPAQTQQPTAPEPPKEEGPRSFGVFLRKLAAGEAESALSYEQMGLFRDVANEKGIPNDLPIDDDQPAREV